MEVGSPWPTAALYHGLIGVGRPGGPPDHAAFYPLPLHAQLPPVPEGSWTYVERTPHQPPVWLGGWNGTDDPTPLFSHLLAMLPQRPTRWVLLPPVDPDIRPEWWTAWRDLLTGWTATTELRWHWVQATPVSWLTAEDHAHIAAWSRPHYTPLPPGLRTSPKKRRTRKKKTAHGA